MRRLKSTYTLLSDESSQQQSQQDAPNDVEQFSWSQVFFPDRSVAPTSPSPSYRYATSSLLDSFVQHHNLQNSMEHQHNLLNKDEAARSEQEDYLLAASYTPTEISSIDSESSYGAFGDNAHADVCHSFPMVTSYGSVTILLRHLVRVDISPDGAIYVHNSFDNTIAAINGAGDKSCILHTNSRVFQNTQEVHIATYQNRIAKICQRGVVFSSSSRSLAYLVDESGTKTTADRFLDLRGDFSFGVFYDQQDCNSLEHCYDLVSKAVHRSFQNGDDVWMIGGTQIKQDCYGNIEVSRDFRHWIVTILPTIGEISVKTPFFNATAGCFSKRYLILQMDNRKITSGYCGLTIQNGSQKAGLDRNGKVVIF